MLGVTEYMAAVPGPQGSIVNRLPMTLAQRTCWQGYHEAIKPKPNQAELERCCSQRMLVRAQPQRNASQGRAR